ncbi:MAG: acyl-CoA dehydrogenase [Proteobacteria bacterium]|nr:MAG: acyl-CoA dehydrogenase [Pseudomonadota bacterium]
MTALQADVQARARALAAELLAPRAAELDATGRFPVDAFAALAARGLMAITAPAAHGGLAGDTVALVLALREVARACPSTAVGMSVTNMVAETIARFGAEPLQALAIPKLASGEAITGSFCLSEPGAGSDAAALRATARRDGDHYVLDGTKQWITSGAFSKIFIVMARTADLASGHRGISAFVVEACAPGLSVAKAEEKTGLCGSNTVPIVLEGCRVPAASRLAEEGAGFRIAMTALDGGRITIGAMANGIARAALDAVVAHLRGAAPGVTRAAAMQTLGRLEGELRAAELLVTRAARLKAAASRGGAKRFTREAAMAKLHATENAKRVTMAAVELLGPRGLDGRRAVERLMRDARVTTIFEGTSEIQRLVLARDTVARLSGEG